MKVCSKCKIEKELTEFNKRKKSKDGFEVKCKTCYKQHYQDNKKYILLKNKQYYQDNKKKIIEFHKQHYIDNKEKIIVKNTQWRKNNPNYQKQWRENNPEYEKQYDRQKRQTNLLYKFKQNIRGLINQSLRKKGYKKSSKTEQILGCTFEQFKSHIESQFEPWMNWSNKGLYNGELNYGWDIDHKIPLSSAGCETRILMLNHYTNLQPLCSKINRDIKKDKTDYYE